MWYTLGFSKCDLFKMEAFYLNHSCFEALQASALIIVSQCCTSPCTGFSSSVLDNRMLISVSLFYCAKFLQALVLRFGDWRWGDWRVCGLEDQRMGESENWGIRGLGDQWYSEIIGDLWQSSGIFGNLQRSSAILRNLAILSDLRHSSVIFIKFQQS